jgi:mannose-6-phosphate isomerase-like protein (cupin superfamily)
MDIRRVVTGHDADGKAIVADDQVVPPATLDMLPGSEFHQLWGSDVPMTFPDDGSRPETRSYFPPVGGFRFGFFNVPPAGDAGAPEDLNVMAGLREFEKKLPGMTKYLEPDAPGMHTTATVDYGVILSGQAIMELDDGVQVTLNAGDTFIQNGTRHRWSNTGDVPAVIAITLIGAHHHKVG